MNQLAYGVSPANRRAEELGPRIDRSVGGQSGSGSSDDRWHSDEPRIHFRTPQVRRLSGTLRFLIVHLVAVIESAALFLRGAAMRCDVCGMDYGLSHHCSGIPPLLSVEESAPPPASFSPGCYLALAFNIARWDDLAIRRASRDSNAIYYGAFLWSVAAMIILIVKALPRTLAAIHFGGAAMVIGVVIGLSFGLAVMATLTFVQLGLCHLIAKWFFGGTGRYLGVMRPLLLGWFVNCLILIPVAGTLAAAIAWTAVLMMVFEEVEGISRLQAFGISAGINVCFFALQLMMTPVTRHL